MNTININSICENGDLKELIRLQNENYILQFDDNAIHYATRNGHVHILNILLK